MACNGCPVGLGLSIVASGGIGIPGFLVGAGDGGDSGAVGIFGTAEVVSHPVLQTDFHDAVGLRLGAAAVNQQLGRDGSGSGLSVVGG